MLARAWLIDQGERRLLCPCGTAAVPERYVWADHPDATESPPLQLFCSACGARFYCPPDVGAGPMALIPMAEWHAQRQAEKAR